MFNHNNSKEIRALLQITLVAVSAALCWGGPATSLRTVKCDSQRRTDPLLIAEVMFGTSEVQCGLMANSRELQPVVSFEAGDDWIRNVTVQLYNHTNKTIVFAQIEVSFPQLGDGTPQHPKRVYNITLGQIPPTVAINGRTGQPLRQNTNSKPLSFAPGETILLDLGAYLDQLKSAVEGLMPWEQINQIAIRRQSVYFPDGIKWNLYYEAPDPERPGKYKPMNDPKYFPGDERENWPPGRHGK